MYNSIDFSINGLSTIAVSLNMSASQRTPDQDILTYRRYTQREFNLKFSALLRAYEDKYSENSKKQLFEYTLSYCLCYDV